MDRQVMNRWTKRGMTGDEPGLSALWEAPFAVGTIHSTCLPSLSWQCGQRGRKDWEDL